MIVVDTRTAANMQHRAAREQNQAAASRGQRDRKTALGFVDRHGECEADWKLPAPKSKGESRVIRWLKGDYRNHDFSASEITGDDDTLDDVTPECSNKNPSAVAEAVLLVEISKQDDFAPFFQRKFMKRQPRSAEGAKELDRIKA
jgi:hypothetical protein